MNALPRLLVIDDEPLLHRVFARLFAARYELTAVTSCEDALTLVRAGRRFDAILCDLHLKGMSGHVFYDELLSLDPDQAERVVVHSGSARDAADELFLENVRGRFLSKPALSTDIDATVHGMIAARGRAA